MWPPRRMRHLLRRASSCLRFSRRRRDASATGEAMRARACLGSVQSSGRCGYAASAALGYQPPLLRLEPGWAPGAPRSQAGVRDLDKKLALLVQGAAGSACTRASAFSSLPCRGGPPGSARAPGQPTPGSYLRAPTRLSPDCACAFQSRVLAPGTAGGPGPTARAPPLFLL